MWVAKSLVFYYDFINININDMWVAKSLVVYYDFITPDIDSCLSRIDHHPIPMFAIKQMHRHF